MRFKNRQHAARLLVDRLSPYYKNKHPLVLGVPRGAVPMAKVIADALGGELDVVLVRKLGHPLQPELAIGAIDENGNAFLSDYAFEIEPEYPPQRRPIDAHDRIVIVVDDGIATGSTMTAALRAVRAQKPKKLIGAVAVASPDAARAMLHEADAMVCLKVPARFDAVGQFFRDFAPVSDEDVAALLQQNDSVRGKDSEPANGFFCGVSSERLRKTRSWALPAS